MNARRPARPAALAVAVAGLLVGCGGSGPHPPRHRAGAEPAVAPAPARAPAGQVVRVGAQAEGIVADPRAGLVAVAVREPTRIALLSARTGRLLRHVSIAGPARHLQLDGSTLLVPEAPIGRVLELPLTKSHPARAPRSIATGSLPHDAAALDGRVFVADEFGHAVSVLSGARQIREIRGFTQPGGLAAVGKDVALVDVGADVITLIDGRSLKILGRVPVGSGITHDVAGSGGRIYVADTRGGALFTLATRPRLRVLSRLALPGRPYGIASDPAHDRLWVSETATNRLVELSTASPEPRILATYPTVRQPNTVAVDPANRTVFVAGAATGVVEVIHPRR